MLSRIRRYVDKVIIRQEPLLNGFGEKLIKRYVGVILCLHRVEDIDPNRLWINQELKVSPAFLERLVVKYLKHGIDIISLDEVISRITEGSNKPFVCFTFDDGYKDNYLNAYPIFKKYNVPFCINIASSFPEKTAILFWDILEELLLNNDIVTLNDGTTYICDTRKRKEQAFVDIRSRIFKIPVSKYEQGLKELLCNYHLDMYAPVVETALDWSNILELKESGLCTFGNHTHSHISVLDTSESDLIKEISLCNELYKKNTGDELRYFCYPYGRYDELKQNIIIDNFSYEGLLTLSQKYLDTTSNIKALHRISLEEKKK